MSVTSYMAEKEATVLRMWTVGALAVWAVVMMFGISVRLEVCNLQGDEPRRVFRETQRKPTF